MPWGWECRAKLIKQRPPKSTVRKGIVVGEAPIPGPQHYKTPGIFCGKGFSRIKRAPAYTFGHRTPLSLQKPVTTPHAPMINVQGYGRTGRFKITHGLVTPRIDPVFDKTKIPGPGAHVPRTIHVIYKRAPAYTLTPAARPPYEAWDQWTPPPNMYCPPIPGKQYPAFTLGDVTKERQPQEYPGPGAHNPNFNYTKKNKPAFSFGAPFRTMSRAESPAPNTYCEKKGPKLTMSGVMLKADETLKSLTEEPIFSGF